MEEGGVAEAHPSPTAGQKNTPVNSSWLVLVPERPGSCLQEGFARVWFTPWIVFSPILATPRNKPWACLRGRRCLQVLSNRNGVRDPRGISHCFCVGRKMVMAMWSQKVGSVPGTPRTEWQLVPEKRLNGNIYTSWVTESIWSLVRCQVRFQYTPSHFMHLPIYFCDLPGFAH